MTVIEQVQRWLVAREQWIVDGGPDRLKLCETWREVAMRYGDESPPALGCIEHGLLPAAWPGCHFEIHIWEDGSSGVYVHDHDGTLVHHGAWRSKAESLVAALLAAPESTL
jgi:hypothetical protein